MEITLAELISNKCEDLIVNKNGFIMGQCLTAVGWVGGTIPKLINHDRIIELSMADVANGGIAVGAALNKLTPTVYVVRYQGFLWYNAISIVNYAAKSYELFGVECPLLVRAIAMEGGIGPVAGGSHHSLFMRMPGVNLAAPMTPNEWIEVWEYHFNNPNPTIVSEHRLSYKTSEDFPRNSVSDPEVSILAISSARITANKASIELSNIGIKSDLYHLLWLSPLKFPEGFIESLIISKLCVLIDSDYEYGGLADTVAIQILKIVPNAQIKVMGLAKKSAGFSAQTDNIAPSSEYIFEEIKGFIFERSGKGI
jgi:pyruvate/2-oxoglutarate/acetoin dehydrogenase E1 component